VKGEKGEYRKDGNKRRDKAGLRDLRKELTQVDRSENMNGKKGKRQEEKLGFHDCGRGMGTG